MSNTTQKHPLGILGQADTGNSHLVRSPEEVAEIIFGFVLPGFISRDNARCRNDDHHERCLRVTPECQNCLSLLFVCRTVRRVVLQLYEKIPIIAFIDDRESLDFYWLFSFIHMLANRDLLTIKWHFQIMAGAQLEIPEEKMVPMTMNQQDGRRLVHQFFQRTQRFVKEVVGTAISTAARQCGRSSSARIVFEKGRLESTFRCPRSSWELWVALVSAFVYSLQDPSRYGKRSTQTQLSYGQRAFANGTMGTVDSHAS